MSDIQDDAEPLAPSNVSSICTDIPVYYDSQDIYDYVIFYAESDRQEVVQFKMQLESKYGLRGITYDDHTEECPYIPSEFSRTSFLLKRSVFIFFYLTENLLDPDLEEQTALNRDEALMLTLKDPLKRSTLIPIFPKPLSNVDLPYGFNGLRGFRLFDKYHTNAVKNTFLTERFKVMKKVLKQKLAAEREEWIKRSIASKKEEPPKIKRSSNKPSSGPPMVHIENSVVHIGDQIFHQQSGNIQGNLRDPRMEPNLNVMDDDGDDDVNSAKIHAQVSEQLPSNNINATGAASSAESMVIDQSPSGDSGLNTRADQIGPSIQQSVDNKPMYARAKSIHEKCMS